MDAGAVVLVFTAGAAASAGKLKESASNSDIVVLEEDKRLSNFTEVPFALMAELSTFIIREKLPVVADKLGLANRNN